MAVTTSEVFKKWEALSAELWKAHDCASAQARRECDARGRVSEAERAEEAAWLELVKLRLLPVKK